MPDPNCPICNRPASPDQPRARRLRPFCSPRCADVDLGRWFTGSYSVPAVEADDDLADESQDNAPSAAARPVLKQP